MARPGRRSVRSILVAVASLAIVTAVVAVLERCGVRDASEVYLLAVVATGLAAGAWAAAGTAAGAFLIYDLLFVEPQLTILVSDPQEWLNLLLLLVVGLVVGRLAGAGRDRAMTAEAREGEASAMFRASEALASAPRSEQALEPVTAALHDAVDARRVWIELDGVRRMDPDAARRVTAIHHVLMRRPDDRPPTWVRIHAPVEAPASRSLRDVATAVTDAGERIERFRVPIAVGDRTFGSVWLERDPQMGVPSPGETRVLAAAADQIARAVDRDRLADDVVASETQRRGDELKAALLDSVSHDLRTPLTSIRAAAGTLMDPAADWSADDRRATARAIDLEADRLNRLVTNLLDMSRIEAGALRPTSAAHVLVDLVEAAVERAGLEDDGRAVSVDIPPDLPPIEVDDVLFGQVLANILDNAREYAGPVAQVAIEARSTMAAGPVRVTIEDAGPGVADAAMPRLFEKFFRAHRPGEGARRGSGAGLAVVRGLMVAMGGTAMARRSRLGGLAIVLDVPAARPPSAVSDGVLDGGAQA